MGKHISELVSTYLADYANARWPSDPKPSPALIAALRRQPEEVFAVITTGRFRKPERLDFRDLDVPLRRVLATVAESIAGLLIPKLTEGYWASRYLFIASAAEAQSAIFVSPLIGLLRDRSIYIKQLVLNLILAWPHLQVSEALPYLDKLAKMKSIRSSDRDRRLVEDVRERLATGRSPRLTRSSWRPRRSWRRSS